MLTRFLAGSVRSYCRGAHALGSMAVRFGGSPTPRGHDKLDPLVRGIAGIVGLGPNDIYIPSYGLAAYVLLGPEA